MRRSGTWAVLAVLLAATAVLGGCAGRPAARAAPPAAVVVASFNFDESRLLAEIYAQALEGAGIPVRREFDLGPRELVWPALRQGLVDVVPEYLGTAVTTAVTTTAATGVAAPPSVAGLSGTALLARLRALLRPWSLVPLTPSRASDQNALAVLAAVARGRGLATIDDLVARLPPVVLAGPSECPTRPLCLPGLERVYGLRVRAFAAFDDTQQRFAALSQGDAGAEITFTTDPLRATGQLVVLADDRHLQPDEAVTPVVSSRLLARWGRRAVLALDAVSAALTTPALTFLNWRVSVAGKSLHAEAAAWLRRHGLPAA